MQILMGEVDQGIETLRAFHTLWMHLGFHPEGFNLVGMHVQAGQKGYPLRPEHAESLFYAHRATGGDEFLSAGVDLLRALDRLRLPCGYAAVGDVLNGTLEDKMESFFLSETLKCGQTRAIAPPHALRAPPIARHEANHTPLLSCLLAVRRYLYLLFDPDDAFYAHGRYVFTTEAHPLPLDLSSVGQASDIAALTRGGVLAARDASAGGIDPDDAKERAAAAAEAEEAAEIAVALAQLQGLPHPDDPIVDTETDDEPRGGVEDADSSLPLLVGSCALPSAKVRTRPCNRQAAIPTRQPPVRWR